MGWRGTVRTIQAASRRADREAQRRNRELQKQEKEFAKMEALEQAIYEVKVYENRIDLLQSIHKESGNLIDWISISEALPPEEPKNKKLREKNFKPGLFTKLLGRVEKAKENEIIKDRESFEKSFMQWEIDYKEWEKNKELAMQVLNHEENAQLEVIEKINPFEDLGELGSSLRFITDSSGIISVELTTHDEDIIPNEVKSLLKSGKLSTKKMSKGMYYEYYQDYISSCVLRIGNELLAILPEEIVLVHVIDNMLNTKTGHMENQCILSVAISRETIQCLNMDMIDPSDSLENFVHNMKFKKTKGFESVDRLTVDRFI